MAFQFRLRTILKLRHQEREQQQQFVASARINLTQLIADHDLAVKNRTAIIDELREINDSKTWALDQVMDRKRHAEQLNQAIAVAEAAVVEAKTHLQQRLESLLKADQSVKVLERLAERRVADYDDSQQKLAARNECDV